MELFRLKIPYESNPISDRTLLQMGGKKRKREDISSKEDEETAKKNLQSSFNAIYVSNKQNSIKFGDEGSSKKQKFVKKNKRNTKKNNQTNAKNRKTDQVSDCHVRQEILGTRSDDYSAQKKFKKKNRKRGNNFNQRQYQNCRDTNVSDNFQSFDYSSVNFNQFQGGAVDTNSQNIKSKFKSKVSYKLFSLVI